jgi:cytoskeleton protein RodZ
MNDEAIEVSDSTQEHSDGKSLGTRLREAREASDLSVEKIADELRIEEHVLVALESDRLSDIKAAPVFIKGYIKQYGRLLQLDYEELKAAFENQTNAEDIRLRPNTSIQLRDERQITIWIIAAIAVLIVAGALALWWFNAEEVRIPNPFSGPADTDQAVVLPDSRELSLPMAGSSSASEPAAAATERERSPVTVSPRSELALESPAPPTRTDEQGIETVEADADEQGAAEAGAESGSAGEAGAQSDTSAIVAASEVPLPAEPEPGSVAMSFSFAQESWFELTDARGRRLYYDLVAAGAQLSFMALPPARVLIGNADAARITVGSEAYDIPPGSRRGNVASFVIDPQQN